MTMEENPMKSAKPVLISAAIIIALVFLILFSGRFSGRPPASYPERAIEIIVPWAAGGGTDRIARFIASEAEKGLGVPVIVTNSTGGNGSIGHSVAAFAKPDGYRVGNITMELSTISWLGLTEVNHGHFEPVLQFNQDFAAVTVRDDAPWKNIIEFLDDVKEAPGKFSFSGTGASGIWDLARIGMLSEYGINPLEVAWIPSEGAAPAVTELLGGHIEAVTCSYAEVAPLVEAGRLRTLAVMSPGRIDSSPGIPTLVENGIDWTAGTWRGFAVPQNTPQERIDILYGAFRDVVESDEFKTYMKTNGFGVMVRGPGEFKSFLEEDYHRWEDVLRKGGYIK